MMDYTGTFAIRGHGDSKAVSTFTFAKPSKNINSGAYVWHTVVFATSLYIYNNAERGIIIGKTTNHIGDYRKIIFTSNGNKPS